MPESAVLAHLAIRDFAIVDRLDLDLGPGLTALTGETGAGKSILVDAVVLVLGARASPDMVRPGQARAEITAVFDAASAPELASRLTQLALDTEDGECVVRRMIEAEGRSRAFVNGRPVPVQTLRELCHGIVEVHSQHAHHSLMQPENQRRLLDALGGHDPELAAVREAHASLTSLERRRESLLGAFEERESRADYLRFQLEELEAAGLSETEIDALAAEQRRLANAQGILESCASLSHALSGEEPDDPVSRLRESLVRAERVAALDPGLEEPTRLIANALVELEEAGRAIRHYRESVEAAPERLEEVEARLALLHDLARKYRVRVAELPRRRETLRGEVARLASVEEELAAVDAELARARRDYDAAALALRRRREHSGPALAHAVTELLRDLGMPRAALEVRVCELSADASEPARPPHGRDRVELWVRTNAGHEAAPLARIASGGELSRISLALHVAGAARTGSSTLVFDEVDVGIGGGVAERVGRRLREVGASKQVLCVTHLPQIAARATRHLRVQKRETDNTTFTELDIVSGDERVAEIARMLGGVRITSRTLAHAREMLTGEPGGLSGCD